MLLLAVNLNTCRKKDFNMETEVTKAIIDFSPLIQDVMYVIITVVGMGIMFLAKKAGSYIGLKIDDQNRKVVDDVLKKGITYAYNKLDEKGMTKVETSAVVALAANYAITSIPGTLKHFGLTKEDLTDRIIARLGIGDYPDDELELLESDSKN